MTEITDQPVTPLPPAVQQFILHWGNLGDRWGVNRSVSPDPCAAVRLRPSADGGRDRRFPRDRALERLQFAQGTADLGHHPGGAGAARPPHFLHRRNRPLDARVPHRGRPQGPRARPGCRCTARVPRDAQRASAKVSAMATRRLREMLRIRRARRARWYDQMIRLPRTQISALMKLGAGVVRLLDRGRSKERTERAANQ